VAGLTSSGGVAIQVQKIEGEEHELIRPAFIHRRLQPAEGRHVVSVQRANGERG